MWEILSTCPAQLFLQRKPLGPGRVSGVPCLPWRAVEGEVEGRGAETLTRWAEVGPRGQPKKLGFQP